MEINNNNITTTSPNTQLYYDIYNKSIHPSTRETFWNEQCTDISWDIPPSRNNILSHSMQPFYKWFPNAYLNMCYNCIDRYIHQGYGNTNAIIYESYYLNKLVYITYNELFVKVNKLSFILQQYYSINKGDRVVIYMPMIPEGIISMLACTRIGAVHSVVFGGFAYAELAERIKDCEPKLVITASCGIEPKRYINYYEIVCKAISLVKNNNTNIKVLLYQRYDALYIKPNDINTTNTIIYNEIENTLPNDTYVKPISMCANDTFFILYTSGTSGIPKGIVRDYSSIVSINFTMKYIMNIHKGDTVFSTSDIGWIVGHIFIVYGPLLRGATTTIFEGKPVGTPHCGKCWEIIQRHNIKAFYTSPTALRAVKQQDPLYTKLYTYNLSSLQSLHLSGERCDPETFKWINNALKRNNTLINDQWWQTETGWPICCNNVSLNTFALKPGVAGPPLMGYVIKVLDEDMQHEVMKCYNGKICIELPCPPGFMRTLYNNDNAFVERYISKDGKYYITGDVGFINEDGFVCVMGRDDDMIKVAGHRLSTGKIEEVIAKVKGVVECAVVPKKDTLKGEVPIAFVICEKDVVCSCDVKKVKDDIMLKVINDIGRICALKDVIVVDKLPKTRSGKIIRQLLKGIVNNETLYIPPTIEDKDVVKHIIFIFSKSKL